MRKLEDLAEITVGQIIARVRESEGSEMVTYKVLQPRSITEGAIIDEFITEETLSGKIDGNRFSSEGDVVIKLSTPYEAAVIDEAHVGCLVPSFCATVKANKGVSSAYICALINSSYVREQLKAKIAGTTRAMVKITDLRSIEVPELSKQQMESLGEEYLLSGKKRLILKQLADAEKEIMDARILNSIKGEE